MLDNLKLAGVGSSAPAGMDRWPRRHRADIRTMNFTSESKFEKHLRMVIKSRITSENPNVYALRHKTIGDIVIVRDGVSPAMFFLEIKYYQSSKGRIGIGNSSGGGIQPEILKKRPAYLEFNLRWIFGSDVHESDKYWFVTSNEVRKFVSGQSIGKKQNNIQKRLFRQLPSVDEDQLVEQLKKWLM